MPDLTSLSLAGEHVRDGKLLLTALASVSLALLFLGWTSWSHQRNLQRIKIRIHVAGTRGKSTTTRMIAAGLRASGLRVLAKATGSAPRLIMPDGQDRPWPRRGPASIREQIKFFSLAAQLKVDAVVVECMAVRPELIAASQSDLVQAHMTVITNTRPDHFEELGEEPDAMAKALAFALPKDGHVIMSDESAHEPFVGLARSIAKHITIVTTDAHIALNANGQITRAACAALGATGAGVERAIDAAPHDPGFQFTSHLTIKDKQADFINAFACNDVNSLRALLNTNTHHHPHAVLINARGDRPLRSKAFLKFLASLDPSPKVFLAGDQWAQRLAQKLGLQIKLLTADQLRDPHSALAAIMADLPSQAQIWGIGNFQGFGEHLIAQITSVPHQQAPSSC